MKQKVQRQRQKKEPVGEAKKPREVRLYVEAINSVDCVTVVMETIFFGITILSTRKPCLPVLC